MAAPLQHELKMTRPFESLPHEAHRSIARTAALLDHAVDEAFRDQEVTATQFNVLRILRGAGDLGWCRAEIGERGPGAAGGDRSPGHCAPYEAARSHGAHPLRQLITLLGQVREAHG